MKHIKQEYLNNRLYLFLFSLIIIGVFFRFSNLDLKVFWVDEVINTHYTFGYTEVEIGNQVKQWDGQVISISDLHRYQSPSLEKSPFDTVKALATEEPQSPPLHYLVLRSWIQLFGDSVTVKRSLSACFSLLAFPCIYWLSLQLFQSSLASWLSVALVAISPFHLIYAQEARYYAAWTTLTLLLSGILLWARRHSNLGWFAYTGILIVGLYTYPMTLFVAISHGTYIALMNKLKINQETFSYLLATLFSLIAFSPWCLFIVNNSGKMSNWRQVEVPLLSLIESWVTAIEIGFWDFHNYTLNDFSPNMPFLVAFVFKMFLMLILAYAVYILISRTAPQTYLFIFALIFVPWLMLASPDLLTGGIRSTVPRYLAPSYIGIQLTAAYLFSEKLTKKYTNLQKNVWSLILCIFTLTSVISCVL